MLKEYFDRDSSISKPITVVNTVPQESNVFEPEVNSDFIDKSDPGPSKLENSDILRNLNNKLSHLGQVKPLEAKVNAISEFPVPKCKRQLMRFLGMAGYYRKFCKNFSSIAERLTNLLKKNTKFKWNDKCQDAFDRLKAILGSAPVLLAPDFDKCFKLAVDASDVGIGAVLL